MVPVGETEFSGEIIPAPLPFFVFINRLAVDAENTSGDDWVVGRFDAEAAGEILTLFGLNIEKK